MLLHSLLHILMLLQLASIIISSSSTHEATTYIIHMDISAMPKPFSNPQSWYQSTITTATTSTSSNLIYVYDHALHGFTARLTPSQLKQLKKSHGTVAVYSDMLVKKDTTHTTDFLGLTASAGLWPASNYGEDMIIGVVDSGVSPESKSFIDDGLSEVPPRWKGECEESSMCNGKIIGARSFYKGLLANNPNLSIVGSSRDTDGHGTHTASTACGNFVPNISFFGYGPGTARGVAPHAKLAVYKVLWEEGAYASDIIAGIDKAISDGVDVLSISLGVNNIPLYKDPVAIAGFAAIEKGILVVTSTGNDGPFLGTLHNGAPWLITVGASTVDRKFAGIIELGDEVIVTGQSLYLGSETLPSKLPLVNMEGCDNQTLLDKVGYKIVVCQTNTLGDVISSVASSKVAAGLFVSNDPFVELSIHLTQPGAILSQEDGNVILDYINKSPDPRATLGFKQTILGTRFAPQVTVYSSRGPSMSCPTVLKPDVVAPGALVLASWAENSSVGFVGSDRLYSSYNIISGSSMSCPHVSGLGALLKSVHSDWTPAAIRSAIMTSASPVDNSGAPIIDSGDGGRFASPLAMGSGHIVPNKALDPGLIYDIEVDDYINFLCTLNFTHEQIKTVTKTATNCSDATPDLNYPSFIAFFKVNETPSNNTIIREFERTVTNVGDTPMTYIAKVMPVKGFRVRVEPEMLIFNGEYKKQRFKLILEGQMENKENEVVYGSLTWIDTMGKYSVRSPIVATTIN